MAIITYQRGSGEHLTRNFKKSEFDCNCGCRTTKHDTALSAGAQKLRDLFGCKITVKNPGSGYRCASWDKRVGGSGSGQHTKGKAADMYCEAVNPVCFAIVARELGIFKGVGIYWYTNAKGSATAFVHCDTRSTKCTWLRSLNGESYRYTTLHKFILPTVRKGSTGNVNKAAVRMLQRLLGISVDGVFGTGTERAVKEAQRAAGITVDGVCGPETWKHISGAHRYL